GAASTPWSRRRPSAAGSTALPWRWSTWAPSSGPAPTSSSPTSPASWPRPLAESNESLFKRASEVMPGGVSSPVRAFRSVGGTPYLVARGEGAHVWDVEGRRYVDYVQSYGASILGHAHPAVVDAIARAAADGTTFGAPTEREVLLAEAIRDRVAGCDMVRMVSSGTEAAMSAVRAAR